MDIDGVEISKLLYQALKVQALNEQRDFSQAPKLVTICPWCGLAGSEMELHHWLLKRSTGIDSEYLHRIENVVLLHALCHRQYGQTRAMTEKIYQYKSELYDLSAWLNSLNIRSQYYVYLGNSAQ